MIPPIIFILITLISGAGAAFSYAKYRQTKREEKMCPDNQLELNNKILKQAILEKAIDQAVKPHQEKINVLENKLAKAETLFKDLRVARSLAPETKQEAKN